jgi:NDP-4-keto-2,6-dideoxyhexose 3-C-methyltransferase
VSTDFYCRLCKQSEYSEVLSLGRQPISSIFPNISEPDPLSSPLDLVKCDRCNFIQLRDTAPLSEMYGSTYGYHSALSPTMVTHLKAKVESLVAMTTLNDGDAVLDIGCNDGTLLNSYASYGNFKRYGVDPSSEKFSECFDGDISVVYDFFGGVTAQSAMEGKQFKVITSIAMFYDLDNPAKFVEEVSRLLDPEGIWALELSYWPLLLSQLTYDQICHEHVGYYGLSEIVEMIKPFGLRVVDIEFNDINGGSIYILVSHLSSRYLSNEHLISDTLRREADCKSRKVLDRLKRRVIEHKTELTEYLKLLKEAKKSVFGYGASTKGNIVLNYLGVGPDLIVAIGDANLEKHGRVTPGSRIPILSHTEVKDRRPDYIVVLIWHFRNEVIVQNLQYLLDGGKLIFVLPRIHVISKHNYQDFLGLDFKDLEFSI